MDSWKLKREGGATTSDREQEVTWEKKVTGLDKIGDKSQINRKKGKLDNSHNRF